MNKLYSGVCFVVWSFILELWMFLFVCKLKELNPNSRFKGSSRAGGHGEGKEDTWTFDWIFQPELKLQVWGHPDGPSCSSAPWWLLLNLVWKKLVKVYQLSWLKLVKVCSVSFRWIKHFLVFDFSPQINKFDETEPNGSTVLLPEPSAAQVKGHEVQVGPNPAETHDGWVQ